MDEINNIQDLERTLHETISDLEALENEKEFTGEEEGKANLKEKELIKELSKKITDYCNKI